MFLSRFPPPLQHPLNALQKVNYTSQGEYMSLDADTGAEANFSDLPHSEALEWMARLAQHSTELRRGAHLPSL